MTAAAHTAIADTGQRDSYDREAARYDERRYHSTDGQLFSELETTLLHDWLRLRQGDRVLDIPTGTGRLCYALSSTGATVVGADISANMLAVAASKRGAREAQVQFTQGSGTSLPFPDDTFDAVVSFKFFHLIDNARKPDFVREMTRVLKPGRSLVIEFNSPFYGVVLAWFRYYFRKKHPGGMRMKCIFPDQIPALFAGLEIVQTRGVKLPFTGALASLVGRRAATALNLWFGRLPGAKYLAYAVMVEARKPAE